MKKYEYICVYISGDAEVITEMLNKYGGDGWELVCVYDYICYFKREIK